MNKKWKIFGYQTKIGWFDVKTKFKHILRSITYSWLLQELISIFFVSYMKFVYVTSKKKFINEDKFIAAIKDPAPLIITFWHNRLLMAPFIVRKRKKLYPDHKVMSLASEHGDGRFVGKIMEKFGMISILGSTNNSRKPSRGISTSSLRTIIKNLKKGYSFGITPDGPRGPNQKINGEVVAIAKIAKANIIAASYSSSKMKILNSWDKFKVPLPFATLCFYFDETLIKPGNDQEKTNKELEERMNFAQEQSIKYL